MMNAELCKFNPYFFYALGSEAMFACAALLPLLPNQLRRFNNLKPV